MNEPMNDAAIVDAMASNAMGIANPSPAPAPAAPNPNKDAPKSPAEAATAESAPSNPGEKSPVIYEIEDKDGNKIPITADQYLGLKDRYAKLNYEHAQLKPALDLVKGIMKTHNIDAKTAAGALHQLANQPIQGGNNKQEGKQKQAAQDDALAMWERENGVDAGPIRETNKQTQAMMAQIMRQNQMIEQLLARQSGVTQAAADATNKANATHDDAMARTFANNMSLAQQKFSFTDEQFNQFTDYYKQRGYVEEDFIDPYMTLQVAQDFYNSSQAPRLNQLRTQAERRLAATGSMGSSPASPANSGTPDKNQTDIDRIANRVMMERNPG